MTSWSASPRTRQPSTSRTPTWLVAVATVLLLAGGIFLILHPFLPHWAFMVLAAAGLTLVGLGTKAGILVQQPTFLPWTIGAFLASFLVVRWLFPTLATTWVVTFMIAALILNGLAR